MKWVKSKYELTIREVSLMFETEDPRIISRWRWVPAFILNRYYAKFLLDFSEMFNAREVNNLIGEDIYRLKLINRANNILYPVYIGLMLNDSHPEFRRIFEDVMGRKYNSKDDLKLIIKEIERLKSKLAEAGTAQDRVQGSEKMSFESVVANTEMMLERSLPRDMRLWEFKKQYDLAIARARELEKLKNK